MAKIWIAGLLLAALLLTPWPARAGDEGQPARARPTASSAVGTYANSAGVEIAGGRRGPRPQEATRNDSYCLTCHGDANLSTRLADGSTLSLHVDGIALRDSVHSLLGCVTCHTDRETDPPRKVDASGAADYEARAAEMCVSCHLAAAGDYAASAHGAPVLSRSDDGATCNDCHSPDGSGHSIARATGVHSTGQAEAVAESCGRCHKDELASYRRTTHSRLVRLGDDQRRAATCTNCHGDHAVMAIDDPSRPLAPDRLAVSCQECHRDADAGFAGEWLGHEAASSPAGLAGYADRAVVLLTAVTVAFGLVHVALDVLRTPRPPRRGPK